MKLAFLINSLCLNFQIRIQISHKPLMDHFGGCKLIINEEEDSILAQIQVVGEAMQIQSAEPLSPQYFILLDFFLT